MACHFSEFFVIGLDGESTEEFLSHRSDAIHCPRALGAQVAGFVGECCKHTKDVHTEARNLPTVPCPVGGRPLALGLCKLLACLKPFGLNPCARLRGKLSRIHHGCKSATL